MNSQKELHDNELAAWLGKLNTSVEPYTKLIAVVVFALIAAAVAWGLYTSKLAGDRSDATLQLLMRDPEVADKYPGTPAAAWSLLNEGNDDLESGIASLYQNRGDAETMLSQARDSFNDALKSSDDRLLRSRANLGLAMASESLGELDQAIESYREVIKVAESDAMVAKAKSRIDELSAPETKDFIAWFEKQDFSPADPSLPPEMPLGTSLPDMPDLKLSTLGGDTDGDSDDAMELEDKSGLELPAEGEETKGNEETPESSMELPPEGDEKKADAVKTDAAETVDTVAAESKKVEADEKPAAEKPSKEASTEEAPAEDDSAEEK